MSTVESLEVTVLVDNATDSLSSNPGFVETEFAFLRRHGMKWLSGACLCCAAHGLSCLITAKAGGESRTLLFDTGPDSWVFERNVTRLGLDLGAVGGIVLSHGHWDHGGALPRALQMIAQANGGRSVPVHLHPEMFALRATRTRDGKLFPMEPVPGVEALAGSGGDPRVTREAQTVLGDAFFISGEIPRRTPFERGFPGQQRQMPDGSWAPDEIMPDERFVAVNVAGKGLVVFTACSHAGLVNVLLHARERFPDVPVYGVFGGFHLSGNTEAIIPETVAALKAFDLKLIAAGHCTGWRAINALASAYGDAVVPSAVGKVYRL
ncbi:MAG TPA: MBL fold metallo-hydrolase [Dongiaceae bacterium]|jgi:7,8-dihydropterin-6-yl-methyl-4-(beta-D-ribofuranosyl)aminobenzene 5'-phosphate synthase|nr:MBL fold metallo-hydrolase [Dongiaceae bacterium]